MSEADITTPFAPSLDGIRRYEFIDSLRGIAILGVVMIHASQETAGLPDSVKAVANLGGFGVQLFFMVSAVTLFMSHNSRQNEDRATLKFFIRRFTRILPMYYVGLVFYPALAWFAAGARPPWIPMLICATFLNAVHPMLLPTLPPGGWSVVDEMIFYMTLPWLFKRIKSLNQAMLLVVATLLASLAIHGLMICGPFTRLALRISHHDLAHTPVWDGWFLYFWFPNQMPIFALGILAYFARDSVTRLATSNRKAVLAAGAILSLLALAILLFTSEHLWYLPHNFIAGIMFLCLILLLCAGFHAGLLVNRVTAFLGMISFSIYITHFPIRDGLDYLIRRYAHSAAAIPPLIYFPLYMCILLLAASAVSFVTYNVIELRGIELGRALIHRLRPSPHRATSGIKEI